MHRFRSLCHTGGLQRPAEIGEELLRLPLRVKYRKNAGWLPKCMCIHGPEGLRRQQFPRRVTVDGFRRAVFSCCRFEFECNVCNVNNVCIPTRRVLFLCFHDQYMVCSVLIEPKMSSGGHRAAEKSSSSL